MLPHLGAGASQGLEDAYVLVRLLSQPEANASNVEVGFLNGYTAIFSSYHFAFPGRASCLFHGQTAPGSKRLGRQLQCRQYLPLAGTTRRFPRRTARGLEGYVEAGLALRFGQ